MSSLQCPARVVLALHGDAEYEAGPVCDQGGSLTRGGREQARRLAARLRGARITRVWTSPMSRAVQTAEIAAAALGVDVVVREGLREVGAGSTAGSSDEVARVTGVLGEVADQHPGEGVLVVSHAGAVLAALPALTGLAAERFRSLPLPTCGTVALEADAEGWRVVEWDGGPFPPPNA